MNRIYRVIWNCTLQVFQACSELTAGQVKHRRLICVNPLD
ncbi:ESPR-type extended signal peptide-containing protein [Escherichia coli]